jgi:ABC-2 type transport system ATP-binding protein
MAGSSPKDTSAKSAILIDKHPHHIVLALRPLSRFGRVVLQWPDVEGVRVLADKNGLLVETRSPDAFYGRLPELSLQQGLAIQSVYSDDDNLEAVFKYLVTR